MQITAMQDELGIGKNLPYLGWEFWHGLRDVRIGNETNVHRLDSLQEGCLPEHTLCCPFSVCWTALAPVKPASCLFITITVEVQFPVVIHESKRYLFEEATSSQHIAPKSFILSEADERTKRQASH